MPSNRPNREYRQRSAATVCWIVTRVRNDPWARKHPFKVHPLKPKRERCRYVNPELYGKRTKDRINHPPTPRGKVTARKPGAATGAGRVPRGPKAVHLPDPASRPTQTVD